MAVRKGKVTRARRRTPLQIRRGKAARLKRAYRAEEKNVEALSHKRDNLEGLMKGKKPHPDRSRMYLSNEKKLTKAIKSMEKKHRAYLEAYGRGGRNVR